MIDVWNTQRLTYVPQPIVKTLHGGSAAATSCAHAHGLFAARHCRRASNVEGVSRTLSSVCAILVARSGVNRDPI